MRINKGSLFSGHGLALLLAGAVAAADDRRLPAYHA